MMKRYNSILETIGNTPVVRLNNIGPKNINLYVKVESFNPMGSVKDRLALGVIEDAERRGELKPGQTIVEATSGNTGIGLAMVCAQKGYPLVITMAENFSVERRKLMRFLGAKVVLTPADKMGSGMVDKARELAEKHGWWQSKQFQNPANADIHAKTTAVEILESFDDIPLDFFVSGFGTGGTLNGVARVLREKSPNTKIVACEPDNSPVLASGLAQKYKSDGSHAESHPMFRPHLMQGWAPDFVPKLMDEVRNKHYIDQLMPINGNLALQLSKDLASKEGIFVGISAGATLAGALKIAETAADGANILCMLPDTGERYLSTPLFQDVAIEMTADEMEISKSTPNFRFDISDNGNNADEKIVEKNFDEAARDEVLETISDPMQPVIMFGLEWCEFCWSVKKIMDRYKIAYRSIDLDSVEYAENDRGLKMRNYLDKTNNWETLPQIYIGGEFVGGCTDLFDKCIDKSLQSMLDQYEIPYDKTVNIDPYSLLPNWLLPR